MNINTLLDTIDEIVERTEEASVAWKKDKTNHMEYGRTLAFCEVLSVLKTDFDGIKEVEQRLNFDIDKKYLS